MKNLNNKYWCIYDSAHEAYLFLKRSISPSTISIGAYPSFSYTDEWELSITPEWIISNEVCPSMIKEIHSKSTNIDCPFTLYDFESFLVIPVSHWKKEVPILDWDNAISVKEFLND